jgi:hypothetical protein
MLTSGDTFSFTRRYPSATSDPTEVTTAEMGSVRPTTAPAATSVA